MKTNQHTVRVLLRVLLFLLPATALVVLGVVGVSFLYAQLSDVPQETQTEMLKPAAEKPLDLSPSAIETRFVGWYLRLQEQTLQTPAGTDTTARIFRVESGDTALAVSQRLKDEGFITDPNLFRMYMRYTGLDQRLATGDFELAPSMTIPVIADHLQHSRIEEIVVTVPEGMRAEEVADLLNVKGIMDGEAFLSLVRGGNASASALGEYSFLPSGLTSLEGYLFPDTYRLPAKATPADLVKRMLDNFGQRVTPDVTASASQAGRSMAQVITIASIVEREAQYEDERPVIASVYWNRASGACNAETGGTYLQADPTVQYAAGRAGEWWWKPPSVEAYKDVVSPYNTYTNPGLPPGPIASPGLSAIQAAAKPADTKYCFFVATGDGRHVFATTLDEHQRNVSQYQK